VSGPVPEIVVTPEPAPATAPALAPTAPRAGSGVWVYRAAVGWLVVLTLLVVLQPWLPFVKDPNQIDATKIAQGPSWSNWFGTSLLGRDVFAQVLAGGRISLRVAVIGTAVGILVGGGLGMLAGYLRGWVDTFVSGVIAVTLSVPALVLVTFIVAVRGQDLFNVTFAVCILAVPALARIVRASTLQVAQREFVKAAEVIGATRPHILVREILPNVLPTLVSFAFLTTGIILVAESSLSFLGLSVQLPAITWGSIIAEGRINFRDTPHMVFLPAAVLFLTVLSLNFVGDHLLKRFDIREAAL
jgi:peptide/nickel transport system permease protein